MFAGMLVACLAIAGPPAFASVPVNVVLIDFVDVSCTSAGLFTTAGAGLTPYSEGGAAIVAAKLAVIENNAISILSNAHGATNNTAISISNYAGTIVLNSIDTGAITPANHIAANTSGLTGHLASTVPRATVNGVIAAYGTAADSAAPAKAKASESA